MAKLKNPYTYPHKSRRAKVNYITSIGGYPDRYTRFPLEFTVGVYYADLDFDSIWSRIEKSDEWGARKPDLVKFCVKDVCKEFGNDLWTHAVEDACRSLTECDTYRMLWDGTPIDAEFSLYGRGGKHLCLTSFEGIILTGMSEDGLEELLMTQGAYGYDDVCDKDTLKNGWEWTIDSKTLDKLYRYVRQCEIDFTSKKASAEVEYQADYLVTQQAIELYDSLFGATDEDHQNNLAGAAPVGYCFTNSLPLVFCFSESTLLINSPFFIFLRFLSSISRRLQSILSAILCSAISIVM